MYVDTTDLNQIKAYWTIVALGPYNPNHSIYTDFVLIQSVSHTYILSNLKTIF